MGDEAVNDNPISQYIYFFSFIYEFVQVNLQA